MIEARHGLLVLGTLLAMSCGQASRSVDEVIARLSLSPEAGPVCGSPDMLGAEIAPIDGAGACGIADPVRLEAVAGVRLSQPVKVTCGTARALSAWVNDAARPVARDLGSELVELSVLAGYACRSRNNVRGARLSEHANGRAIDIGGLGLADGQRLDVLNDWAGKRYGPALQSLHAAACGTFGTVLGPESDRFHRNHFHFDTAGYRSGPYCR